MELETAAQMCRTRAATNPCSLFCTMQSLLLPVNSDPQASVTKESSGSIPGDHEHFCPPKCSCGGAQSQTPPGCHCYELAAGHQALTVPACGWEEKHCWEPRKFRQEKVSFWPKDQRGRCSATSPCATREFHRPPAGSSWAAAERSWSRSGSSFRRRGVASSASPAEAQRAAAARPGPPTSGTAGNPSAPRKPHRRAALTPHAAGRSCAGRCWQLPRMCLAFLTQTQQLG